MIQFDNVCKRYYKSREALSEISFQLESGELAFLTGHSGAGKSTLLKLACMMERSSSGDVVLDGVRYSELNRRQLPYLRRKMGLIFQTPYLLNDKTAFENVALPLVVQSMGDLDIKKRVRAALELVNLQVKEKVRPCELSTGEQQRLGIARAIVHKPSLILADEPTGNLDPPLSAEIMQSLVNLSTFGVTVLIATHDLGLISTMHHRTLVLKAGRLLC